MQNVGALIWKIDINKEWEQIVCQFEECVVSKEDLFQILDNIYSKEGNNVHIKLDLAYYNNCIKKETFYCM